MRNPPEVTAKVKFGENDIYFRISDDLGHKVTGRR